MSDEELLRRVRARQDDPVFMARLRRVLKDYDYAFQRPMAEIVRERVTKLLGRKEKSL